jgi:uncharacterized membrane protein (UPF0127 family)
VKHFLVPVLLMVAAFAGAACGGSSNDGAPTTREPGLALVSIGALTVQAEVPEGDAFYRGLGGRELLPDDRGMLFVFPQPGEYGFWMKDMLIPIDIIWISAEGQVVFVQTAQPEPGVPDNQLTVYRPDAPALYVLEVREGLAAEKGVQVGDTAQIDLP